jgi:ribosomal protein S18 acetylase RimI-like enzyme
VKIRTASPVDHASIAALLLRAYDPLISILQTGDACRFSDELLEAVEQYPARGSWLVGEDAMGLVGCVAYFAPYSTDLPLYQGNCAHFQLLGVDPAHTRRGFGRSLVEACISRAVGQGAAEVRLKTSEYLQGACRLYENLGFTVQEILPPLWGKPAYLYAKRVDE